MMTTAKNRNIDSAESVDIAPSRGRAALRTVTRRGRRVARNAALRASGKSRSSSLFYGVISEAFSREHKAVLAGKKRYLELERSGQQRFLLRRNTHMLEKGLIMRPRRGVFALDYIQATVDCFNSLRTTLTEDEFDLELQWANDVLTEYFDLAGDDPVIDNARKAFAARPLGADQRSSTPGLSPYARNLSCPQPVDYDSLLKLAEHRRSVRWFDDRPVPRDLIDKAMTVAGLSPSACNRQPFEFRIFDDPDLVQIVSEIPMGTRGYAANIPVFVVIVGKLSAFFSERDRHLIYTDSCLAAMSFLIALESLGLSSCCVNWPDIEERERAMVRKLGLQTDERPVMCIALGYPDPEGMVPFSQKKPLTELRRYNFE